MLCHWTILDSVINYTTSFQICLRLMILLILNNLLRTFFFTLKSTMGENIKTKLYDKRNGITLPKVNTPFISSNISASSANMPVSLNCTFLLSVSLGCTFTILIYIYYCYYLVIGGWSFFFSCLGCLDWSWSSADTLVFLTFTSVSLQNQCFFLNYM